MLTRKSFVGGAGVAAVGGLLGGCGGSTMPAGAPNPPSTTLYDVLIVGSGVTAVGAARAVMSYGRSVLMIEAMGRTGGRTLMDNTTFPEQPYDVGAQYFHQALSANVLYGFAQAMGIATVPQSGLTTSIVEGSNVAPDSDVAAFLDTFGSVQLSVNGAGALAYEGLAADVSCAQASSGDAGLPFYQNAMDFSVGGRTGAAFTASSAADLYSFSYLSPAPLAFPPGDDVLIQSGMANFIARLGSNIPVALNAPVTKIDYNGPNVIVTTANGTTYTGRSVIVTASVGVLNAKTISFAPDLPAPYYTAIGGLKMGSVYKGVLGFKSDVFTGNAGVSGMSYVVPLAPEGPPFIVNLWGKKIVMFYCDGAQATALETMGSSASAPLLAIVESHFPGATAAWDGRFGYSSWLSNPYTRGAYSYAIPGSAGARVTLQAGLANKLWFAGEALSVVSHGSIHGGYVSGDNAAHAALGALGIADAARKAPATTNSH